jgi:hypothetical protein
MATLTAFITAFNEFYGIASRLWRLYREAKEKGWVNEGRALAVKIDSVKDDNDARAKLAQDLFNHTRS